MDGCRKIRPCGFAGGSVRRALVAALAAALLALAGCGGDDEPDGAATAPATAPATAATEETAPSTQTAPERERLPAEPRVETLATNLDVPWEIAFLPDGTALVTERPGRLLSLGPPGEGGRREIAELDVRAVGEAGLLGLAVDPAFEENRFLYLYRTTASGNEVARFRLSGRRLEDETVLVSGIRAAPIHDGGRIGFGPGGDLFVTTGDAGEPALAQQPDGLNGKLLRVPADAVHGDGGAVEVHTLGHRNPQGFDWQPGSDRLYASEHGPVGDDEINLIREGRNYGWPVVQGPGHGRFAAPLAVYNPAIAPAGATFVTREDSAWSGDFLVAALRGQQIRRLRFDGERVVEDEALFQGRFGRLRTVVEGPDGALYALTSNTDGRGDPRPSDDRVLRILPPRG